MFLLLLFLDFVFEEREITWLTWLERPLAKIGKLDQLGVVLALVTLVIVANTLAPENKVSTVMVSGALGLATFLIVNALGEYFDTDEELEDELAEIEAEEKERRKSGGVSPVVGAAGKAAFFLFLYLEVLDASFSFDGVIGAFAITSDPIIIAIGLGIGAMFIRSLTVYLVRKGTLSEYVYLEHGAFWAIGTLAVLLLITIEYDVPEVVTGLLGVSLILAAFITSVVRNRRAAAEATEREPVMS